MEEKKTEIECCSEECVHEDLLKIVNDTMPEETELYDLAELFKVLEILPEFESCLYYLKRKCVYVILRKHFI